MCSIDPVGQTKSQNHHVHIDDQAVHIVSTTCTYRWDNAYPIISDNKYNTINTHYCHFLHTLLSSPFSPLAFWSLSTLNTSHSYATLNTSSTPHYPSFSILSQAQRLMYALVHRHCAAVVWDSHDSHSSQVTT